MTVTDTLGAGAFLYVLKIIKENFSLQWMRARWTSDPCYAFYGVDGSDCSFLVYLSEVEWFCPLLAWRNHTATPAPKPLPGTQVRNDTWSEITFKLHNRTQAHKHSLVQLFMAELKNVLFFHTC